MPDVSTPEALLAFVAAQPRQVGDLYPWGARRLYRPRMVRALVADLVEREQLAASDPVALADWSWVWHPEHASGPGTPPPLDLSPEALRVVDAEEPAEEPEEEDERVLPALSDGEEEDDDASPDQLRSRRAREVRAVTIGTRNDKKNRRLLRMFGSDDPHPGGRPRTRAECPASRPCPWVSCRHHLYLDVSPDGAIKINFPDIGVEEMSESCALDVAERGPHALEEVGALLNITRERVRQVETRGAMRMVEHSRGIVRLESLPDGGVRRGGLLAHALPPRTSRAEPGPRHLRLLDLMGERKWMVAELLDATGLNPGALFTQISEARAMGLVERLGRGRYRALPRREEAAE